MQKKTILNILLGVGFIYLVGVAVFHFFSLKAAPFFLYYNVPAYDYQNKIIAFLSLGWICMFGLAFIQTRKKNYSFLHLVLGLGVLALITLAVVNSSQDFKELIGEQSRAVYWIEWAVLLIYFGALGTFRFLVTSEPEKVSEKAGGSRKVQDEGLAKTKAENQSASAAVSASATATEAGPAHGPEGGPNATTEAGSEEAIKTETGEEATAAKTEKDEKKTTTEDESEIEHAAAEQTEGPGRTEGPISDEREKEPAKPTKKDTQGSPENDVSMETTNAEDDATTREATETTETEKTKTTDDAQTSDEEGAAEKSEKPKRSSRLKRRRNKKEKET